MTLNVFMGVNAWLDQCINYGVWIINTYLWLMMFTRTSQVSLHVKVKDKTNQIGFILNLAITNNSALLDHELIPLGNKFIIIPLLLPWRVTKWSKGKELLFLKTIIIKCLDIHHVDFGGCFVCTFILKCWSQCFDVKEESGLSEISHSFPASYIGSCS